jgi:glyceraldehyde 3-phosphate dehydrogenase
MSTKTELGIGIIGLGRVGKNILWESESRSGIEVTAIISRKSAKSYIPLIERDTRYSGLKLAEVRFESGNLVINGRTVAYESLTVGSEEQQLRWDAHNAQIVFEATGANKTTQSAGEQLEQGAEIVIITSPPKDHTPTFVFGVNHEQFSPDMKVISGASCTTNCVAPVFHHLNQKFGVEKARITTVHAITGSQSLVDEVNDKDPRRGRSAYEAGIVPTTTGAAKAIGLVIPDLEGLIGMNGSALRIPTLKSSLAILNIDLKTPTSEDAIASFFEELERGQLKNILKISHDFPVAADFTGWPYPTILDPTSINLIGGKDLEIYLYYDNERGFAANALNLAAHVSKVLGKQGI